MEWCGVDPHALCLGGHEDEAEDVIGQDIGIVQGHQVEVLAEEVWRILIKLYSVRMYEYV